MSSRPRSLSRKKENLLFSEYLLHKLKVYLKVFQGLRVGTCVRGES